MQGDQTIRKRPVKQTCFFEIWCTKEYLLDYIVFRRFVSKRSQSIAIDEMVIKEKAFICEGAWVCKFSFSKWMVRSMEAQVKITM